MSQTDPSTGRQSSGRRPSTSVIVGSQDLDLDGHGGAELTLPAGVLEARLAYPELVGLDLRRCPDLRRLDLSGCKPDLRLSVAQCPALVWLGLPADQPGATLHVDFGPRRPELTAEGAVASIDICWMDEDSPPLEVGTWGADHEIRPLQRRAPSEALHGLFIGRPDADVPPGIEGVILCTGRGPDHLDLHAAARELTVHGATGVRSIRHTGSTPPLVLLLQDLPDLLALDGEGDARQVRLEKVPLLQRISWTGRRLSLEQAGAPKLVIAGRWLEVGLSSGRAEELTAQHAESIKIERCPALRKILASPGATVRIDRLGCIEDLEGGADFQLMSVTIQDIVRTALSASPRMKELALEWVARPRARGRKRQQSLEAIQVLHAAAIQGWDLPQLWALRCARHEASRAPGGPDAARVWGWRFPKDLADRGWEADLRLWRICRDAEERGATFAAPTPAESGRSLATSSEPEHLATLARTAARELVAERPAEDLIELLESAMLHGSEHCGPLEEPEDPLADLLYGDEESQEPPPAVHAVARDQVQSVIQSLVALRTHPRSGHLVRLLCAWIAQRMPFEQGLDLLAVLRTLGSSEATMRLAAFAADPHDAARKQHALALLMRAPTGSLFATPEAHDGSTMELR